MSLYDFLVQYPTFIKLISTFQPFFLAIFCSVLIVNNSSVRLLLPFSAVFIPSLDVRVNCNKNMFHVSL